MFKLETSNFGKVNSLYFTVAAEVRQGQVPPQTVAKAPLPNLRPGVHLRAMRTRELPPPGSDHLNSNPAPKFDEGVESYTYFSGVPGSTQNLLISILTDLWLCEKGYLLDLVMLHSSSNWKFNQRLFWTIFGGQQNSAAVVLVSPLNSVILCCKCLTTSNELITQYIGTYYEWREWSAVLYLH